MQSLSNRIQINKELYIAQYPELALSKEEYKKQEEEEKQHEEALPKMSLIEMPKGLDSTITSFHNVRIKRFLPALKRTLELPLWELSLRRN